MGESLRQVRAGAGHNEVSVGRWSSSMSKGVGAATIACYAPSIPPRKLQGPNRLIMASWEFAPARFNLEDFVMRVAQTQFSIAY